MTDLSEYAERFRSIDLSREAGVLTMRLHTDGGPLTWSRAVHAELAACFRWIGEDDANELVVLTGTGDQFSGPPVTEPGSTRQDMGQQTARDWSAVFEEGHRLIMNLLEIPVPVIGVLNGPAYRHPELPVLSDIVLASETAVIQDATHFHGGLVPGDGVHVVFPLLMGPTRARYFLLTGQALDAQQSLQLGLVNEVLPADRLQSRTAELADQLLRQPRMVRRYARLLLTEELKDRMRRLLGYGLALEGLAVLEASPVPDEPA